MKRNRFIGSVGLTFHSMAPWAFSAIIIRLIIELICMICCTNEVVDRFPLYVTDLFSLLLIMLTGALTHSRHSKLSASVNLSLLKRFLSVSFLSLVLSMLFAFWDIFIVKEFYSVISSDDVELIMFEHRSKYISDIFSAEGLFLFIQITMIYDMFFYMGYIFMHILSGKKILLPIYIAVLAAISVTISLFYGNTSIETACYILFIFWIISNPVVYPLFFFSTMNNHDSYELLFMIIIYLIHKLCCAFMIAKIKPQFKRIRIKQ